MPRPANKRPTPPGQRKKAGSRPSVDEEAKRLKTAPERAAEVVEAEDTGPKKDRALIKATRSFQITWVKSVFKRFINILIYGPYGHGKTTLAASALDVPTMTDVLLINAESGDMSLTSRRDLDIINVKDYDTVARIYEYLVLHVLWRNQGNDAKLLEYEMELKSTVVPLDEQEVEPKEEGRTWFVEQRLRTGKPMDEPYRYRTVDIDSLSEVYKYLIYKFTGVDLETTALDAEIEEMTEWKQAQALFELFIKAFRSLELNVIFVAGETIEPEKRDGKRNRRAGMALPKFAGQAGFAVAGAIDCVGYLYRETAAEGNAPDGKDHRYLYLGAGYEGWISKHRFENLPDLEYITDPTMTTLLDLARKDAELHGTSITPSPDQVSAVAAGSSDTGTPQRRNPANAQGSRRGGGRRGRPDAVRRR